MPASLRDHLESCGVLPVLYAASWLMTCFSSDFPTSFSARIMDVVICDRKCENVLLKVAVTILKRCAPALMAMRDLEHILTHLKLQVPGEAAS